MNPAPTDRATLCRAFGPEAVRLWSEGNGCRVVRRGGSLGVVWSQGGPWDQVKGLGARIANPGLKPRALFRGRYAAEGEMELVVGWDAIPALKRRAVLCRAFGPRK